MSRRWRLTLRRREPRSVQRKSLIIPDEHWHCGTRVMAGPHRITIEPEKLEGTPSVRGLRITVETVVRLVAAGWTFDEILAEYPDLEREDIMQALEYAAASANVHVYRLREPA
jgi:uncharacterized protein (DUF433 family)